MKDIEDIIKRNWDNGISKYGALAKDAKRKRYERDHIRSPYQVDRDRILYSGAFRRYAGKTQVIYFAQIIDEQISNRIIHTQFVSQISRTIGSILGLNIDLIEAAALGHDLGHPPFGHDGERFLSKLCRECGIGNFNHNIHSLNIVDNIAFRGKGMNLTFQVRDAIVSHNGEVNQKVCSPDRKKSEKDIERYIELMSEKPYAETKPFTLEGALIRQCDTISYIGSDIEDAIRIGIIKRSDLPKNVTEYLGNNNSKIIDTLVRDIIRNSYGKDGIGYSDETFEVLKELKSFNYKEIYKSSFLKKSKKKIELGFRILFETYLEDIEKENRESSIFGHFLDSKNEDYMKNNSNYEKVRDFIASMTDRYFNSELENIVIP